MPTPSIPATPAEFLKKYSGNFDEGWDRPRYRLWSKETWCNKTLDMRPATPVEIAEEALEVAASNCRVDEMLDPIRALVDAKVMEVLATIRAADAEQLRLDIERISSGFVSRRDLEASSQAGAA